MLLPPALRTAGLQTTEAMTGLINALKTNFATRFENFSIPTEVMRFVNDPFCVDVVGEFAVKAKELVVSLNMTCLRLELIELISAGSYTPTKSLVFYFKLIN